MRAPRAVNVQAPRRRTTAAALAVLAAAVAGLYAAGSRAAGASAPSCLPAKLNRSARLPGLQVEVSPTPGSEIADPHTQISFLGVPASEIRDVSVEGGRSGAHPGRLEPYSQGDGASFVPSSPFRSGEHVVVHAVIAGKRTSFAFSIDTPYPTAGVKPFPNPTPPPSDYQTFVSAPDLKAPVLSVTTADRDPAAGDILTSNGPGPGRYGALIYAPSGRLIWFDQLSGERVADDLNVQSYDGKRDLTFWQGRVLSLGYGQGEDLILNHRYQVVARIKGGNGLEPDLHEFQIAPGGIAYVTAYNAIRCDLSPVLGPRDGAILDPVIEEIDIKTGLVRWEWHSLDHVNVNDSETPVSKNRAWDWFHLNSIDPEPNGDVFISARNTWAGYQLEHGTGRVLWTLGGLASSFKMGAGAQTAWQHDGRLVSPDEVTFFDDGSEPPVLKRAGSRSADYRQARGVRIALDFAAHTARLVASYPHPGVPLLAASQGDMETLASGNVVVGFGGEPEITELTPHGHVLFDAHLPYDMIFYRALRRRWSARPASAPALRANLNNVGETIVHVSWNGATGVASWRLLAGPTRGSLRAQVSVPDGGFETSTVLVGGHGVGAIGKLAYVEAQALDSHGRVLASSRPERIVSYAAADPRRSG
jgi:Arylsulfotransferase (ASST)